MSEMEYSEMGSQKMIEELSESTKYMNELVEQKKQLVDETLANLSELQRQIIQDKKMLEMLSKTVDPNHLFFSPHLDQDTEVKQLNLKEELKKKEEQYQALEEALRLGKEDLKRLQKINHSYFLLEEEKKKKKESNQKQIEKELLNQNRSLGIKVLQTQENERQRIAMELHDTTVQNLTGLVHKTELCERLLDMDIIRAKLELLTMKETLHNTINDLRTTIYNLRPMSLNDLGLTVTVERFLHSIQMNHKIQAVLKVENEERKNNSVVNLTIYRVIQEACNNVIKHAKAASICVFISYQEMGIDVEIRDDGIGFSIEEIGQGQKKGYGLGISIMKERVYLLSGTLELKSEKGKGTQIRIHIPLEEREEVVCNSQSES